MAVVSDLAGVEPAASRKETVQTTAEVKNVAEAARPRWNANLLWQTNLGCVGLLSSLRRLCH